MTESGTGTGTSRKRKKNSVAFQVVLLTVALLLVYMAVSNVDRSIRAARADGIPGVFTAAHIDCVQHPGHESCTCYGEYHSQDDSVRRDEVYLYGRKRATCLIGVQVAAVDIGAPNRVYGPEGSREWIFTAVLLAVGLGLSTRVVLTLVKELRARRG